MPVPTAVAAAVAAENSDNNSEGTEPAVADYRFPDAQVSDDGHICAVSSSNNNRNVVDHGQKQWGLQGDHPTFSELDYRYRYMASAGNDTGGMESGGASSLLMKGCPHSPPAAAARGPSGGSAGVPGMGGADKQPPQPLERDTAAHRVPVCFRCCWCWCWPWGT